MTIPVFVNDRCLSVAPGTSVRDVLGLADPAWVGALEQGTARITDGRGIALDPLGPAGAGAIIRVAISARRSQGLPDADA